MAPANPERNPARRIRNLFPLLVLVLLFSGCGTASRDRLPEQAVSPKMIHKRMWGGKLPRGSFQEHVPQQILLVVLDEHIPTPDEAQVYLKDKMETALHATGGDVPCHYYLDGIGNIYEGRPERFQSPPFGDHEPKGLLTVGFLDQDLDLYLNQDAYNGLVHLLTWLCLDNVIMPESISHYIESGAKDSVLARDLQSPYLLSGVRLSYDAGWEEISKMPLGPQYEKARRMRRFQDDGWDGGMGIDSKNPTESSPRGSTF